MKHVETGASEPEMSEPPHYTILLVDDSEVDRAICRRLLLHRSMPGSIFQHHVCRLVEVKTGEEALQYCRQQMPDVILLDYSLPAMSGLDVLQTLRQEQGQECLPVIIMTGQSTVEIAVEVLKNGAIDYLDKSKFSAEGLHRAVTSAIQKTQLTKTLQKQQQQQQILTQAALQIRQSLTLEQILQTTVNEVRSILKCDRVVIYQFFPDWSGKVVVESVGAGWMPILGEIIHDPCIEHGWAEGYRQGNTTHHNQIATAGLTACYVELMQRFQVQANLVVPIFKNQHLWGLLIVHECNAPRQWEATDIDFLTQLATHVSIAIQQVALVEQLECELQDRQKAEAALRTSQTQLRDILDNSTAVVYAKNRQGQYLLVNRAYERLTGLDRSQVVGKTDYDLFPEENAHAFWENDRQVFQTLNPIRFEETVPLPDGIHTYIAVKFPLYNTENEPYGVCGISTDISERKQTELALQHLNQELERRVAERTDELVSSNDRLQQELFERKRAERALRSSEMRFRSAFDDAAVGMALVAPEGTFLRGNSSLCQFLGYSQAEMQQMSFQAITHPDDVATDLNFVYQVLNNEIQTYQLEKRYLHKNGHLIWGLLSVSLVRDEQDQPLYFISQIQDISERKRLEEERKQAEAAIQQSEERLQLALEAAGDGLWDWNIVTGELYLSPRWVQMLGFEVGELPSHVNTWKQVVHPEDAPWVTNLLTAHLHDETVPYKFDYRVRMKTGDYKWVANYGKVVARDEQGNPLRMAGTHRDISDRKLSEEALRQSELTLRSFFNNNGLMMGIVELHDDDILHLTDNPTTADFWGTTPEAMKNQFSSVMGASPDLIQLWCDRYREAERTQMPVRFEYLHVTPTRQCWLAVSICQIAGNASHYPKFSYVAEDVTERKQIEAALQHSQSRFAGILEIASDAIISVDLQQRITLFNQGAEKIFGYTTAEVIGQPLSLLLPERYANLHDQHVHMFQSSAGKARRMAERSEIFGRRKNGSEFPAEASISTLNLGNETILTAFLRDISDRKQAETALAKELLRSKALYKASFDGIVTLDRQGYVVESSESFARMLGYSPEEVLTLHVADWNVRWTKAELIEMIQSGKMSNSTFETLHRRKDGSLYDVEISVNEVQLQDEMLLLCISRDISERKQTEAVLLESNRRWRSLLDNVKLLVVGLDCNGNVEYVNPFFLELTNFTAEEVLGKRWMEHFIPGYQQSEVEICFQEVMEHNFHAHYQNLILTKTGEERMIAWSNTLLRDTQGNSIGTVSIGEDITERYKLERMKGEFISMVSHELRTPLTSMQAALSLLVDNIIDPSTQEGQDVIEIAADGVDRLVRLVNDILDLERLESGKIRLEKRTCDTADLVIIATEQMQEMANQAGVILQVDPRSFWIDADGDRLLQVLINLLSNAIKFSISGGTITLSVIPQASRIASDNENEQHLPTLLFTVQDQGRGIPAEKLDSIFERFHQVDASDSREKGGTGLGLAICRSIVQQHGGQIWAESVVDQGSTFYFTLPLEERNYGNETSINH